MLGGEEETGKEGSEENKEIDCGVILAVGSKGRRG